jgi:hypothetical protein
LGATMGGGGWMMVDVGWSVSANVLPLYAARAG